MEKVDIKKISLIQSLNLLPFSPKRKKTNIQFSNNISNNIIKRQASSIINQNIIQISKEQRKKIPEKIKSKEISPILKTKSDKGKNNDIFKDIIFEKMKKKIMKELLDKYRNPYMKHLYKNMKIYAPFLKNQKPLYFYNFQTSYILDKKKCRLFVNYKDHNLIQDSQEYFLKYFSSEESQAYLYYLLYFIYEKDPMVKSKRIACIKKNRKEIKKNYNYIIINKVFGAQKIISSNQLLKKETTLEKKQIKNLSTIMVPKFILKIKPLFDSLNYIYVKDMPSSKIPYCIPNYYPNDLSIYSIIRDYLIKKKYSILIIKNKNYVYEEKKTKRKISSNFTQKSKDKKENNNVLNLNSFISGSSKNATISSERNYINLSKRNMHNEFRRIKGDIDIRDMENFVKKIISIESKKEGIDPLLNYIDSLKNRKDIFLSSLKKPFIGNRVKTAKNRKDLIDKYKSDKIITENDDELYKKNIDITKAINEKIKFLRIRNKELEKKYPLKLYLKKIKRKRNNRFNVYLNIDEDEYNFDTHESNKELKTNPKSENKKNKNTLNNYFPYRFLSPKKYSDFLINNPFLKTVEKIHNYFDSFEYKGNRNNNLTKTKTLEEKKHINRIKENISFSPTKQIHSFKETYKFLIGYDKKENKNNFKKNLINKVNLFYRQFKTLYDVTNSRSNFKKSGPFAFSSFSGSNFDKTENEWKEAENEILYSCNNNSFSSNLLKKINLEKIKKLSTLQNCTTFKQIIKCPSIYE